MSDDLDDIDLNERGDLELRLELVVLLSGIEDLEGSAEFMSFEGMQILEMARRVVSIRYIV